MATPPLRERHHEKSSRLMARTHGDLSDDFLAARRDVGPFTATLADPKPNAPSLISSAHGPIAEILLTIPAYAVEDGVLASAYQDLLAKLPSTTRFRVLTHEAVRINVEAWFAGRTARIVAAPDHLNFSVWAEDGYVIVRDQQTEERVFIEPFAFPRYGDSLIADLVSSATGTGDTQAPLHGAWAHLSTTDAANRAAWEALGFTVRMLGDFHPFAENLGAVHCIKKYLARDQP